LTSTSKNDPNINIIELFGKSATDNEGIDIILPNLIAACIWPDNVEYSPGSDIPPVSTEEVLHTKDCTSTSTSTLIKEIALKYDMQDTSADSVAIHMNKEKVLENLGNVPTTLCAIDTESSTVNLDIEQRGIAAMSEQEKDAQSSVHEVQVPDKEAFGNMWDLN